MNLDKLTALAERILGLLLWLVGRASNLHESSWLERLVAAAEAEARDITGRHEVPANAPADLADEQGNLVQTRSGRPVSTRLLPEDLAEGWMSLGGQILQQALIPAAFGAAVLVSALAKEINLPDLASATLVVGVLVALLMGRALPNIAEEFITGVAVAALSMLLLIPTSRDAAVGLVLSGTLGGVCAAVGGVLAAGWLGGAIALAAISGVAACAPLGPIAQAVAASSGLSLFLWCRVHHLHHQRLNKLVLATRSAAPCVPYGREERATQARIAAADDSPQLILGVTTGQLYRSTGDPLAADQGKHLVLTAQDVSHTHALVLGASGAGKTSKVFAPLGRQWMDKGCGGMLVLDGKGELPVDLAAAVPGMRVIDPQHDLLALIEGMSPDEVAKILSSMIKGDKTGGDDIWRQQAERVIRYGGYLLRAGCKVAPLHYRWTLRQLKRTILDGEFRVAITEALDAAEYQCSMVEQDSIDFFVGEFNKMETGAGDTYTSVMLSVTQFLEPLIGHEELAPWADADHGVDPTACLRGEAIGVATNFARYGEAGQLAATLVQARVIFAAFRRGSNWRDQEGQRQVLMLVDEAADCTSPYAAQAASQLRSMGCSMWLGLQDVSQSKARLGDEPAKALLEQLQSIIALRCGHESWKWVVERVGVGVRLAPQTAFDVPAVGLEAAHLLSVPTLDPAHPQFGKAATKSRQSFVAMALERLTGRADTLEQSKVSQARVAAETKPVVPEWMGQALATPGRAFCQVMRAGVPRRDLVDLARQ